MSSSNPLGKIGYKSEEVVVPKGDKQRRLHKALLRYHDHMVVEFASGDG
jgi:hypothetical protein